MNKIITSITALTLAAGFSLATIAPASADQAAATRNQILGGLALVAGIATAINVSNKNAQAQSIQGYTPSGETVYGDGHVVLPNGQSYYPGNVNQSVACDNGYCTIAQNGSYQNGGYQNGGYHRNWRR